MSASVWLGFLKSNSVTNGANISFGINIVQNRNTTKQNIGNYVVSQGIVSLQAAQVTNMDPDFVDSWNYDHNNFTSPQI
jgi:hypothetical protein